MEDRMYGGAKIGIILASIYIFITSFLVFMGLAIGPANRADTLVDHLFNLGRNLMTFSYFLTFISAIGMGLLRNWSRRLIIVLIPLNCALYLCLLGRQGVFNFGTIFFAILPLFFLIYLVRSEVIEIFKKTTIERGMVYLGIFNIFWSLFLFVMVISNRYQIFSGLLGMFCLISGIGILKRKDGVRKIFLGGIIPLAILTLFNIVLFGKKAAPDPLFSDVLGELLPMLFVFVLLPPCFNFYILTRPTVKERFE